MNTMTLVYIIIAFTVGVIVGWLTMIVPTGRNDLTREETRRLNMLIDRAMRLKRGYTITLWQNNELIDQVTIQEEHYWRKR